MTEKDEGQVIQEDSNEPSHYAMIPKMAMMDLEPYELTLYCHYKMTASEHGKCWKSNSTLATETGMSVTKIKEARMALAEKDFIYLSYERTEAGQINSPPIITIVNVWSKNRARYAKKDVPPGRHTTTPPSPSAHPRSPHDTKEYPSEEELKKKSAPRKRSERPQDLFYNAVRDAFGWTASGRIISVRDMMLGRGKRGTWKDCNFEPPVTDPQEIIDFGDYMRKTIADINREYEKKGSPTRIKEISAAVTIQSWFYDFRAARDAEHPVKATEPTEAELKLRTKAKQTDEDFARWMQEQEGIPTT